METNDYLESLQDDLNKTVTALNLPSGTNFTNIATLAENGGIMTGGDYVEQYSTMPTASASTVGKIVQYIGTTTTQAPIYTNGYFYIGTSTTETVESEEVTTYSWLQLNVQPEGTNTNEFGVGIFEIYNPTNITRGNLFVFEDNNLGIYNYQGVGAGLEILNLNLKRKSTDSNWTINETPIILFYCKNIKNLVVSENTNFATLITGNKDDGSIKIYNIYLTSSGTLGASSQKTPFYLTTAKAQTFSGEKAFVKIPKVSSYSAPTDNRQFTPKQYVDDKPKTYTGYDATKTQVLKNVNGTLTWVDEA